MRPPTEEEREDARYDAWLEKHGKECDCGQLLGSEDEFNEHNWSDADPCPFIEKEEEGED